MQLNIIPFWWTDETSALSILASKTFLFMSWTQSQTRGSRESVIAVIWTQHLLEGRSKIMKITSNKLNLSNWRPAPYSSPNPRRHQHNSQQSQSFTGQFHLPTSKMAQNRCRNRIKSFSWRLQIRIDRRTNSWSRSSEQEPILKI